MNELCPITPDGRLIKMVEQALRMTPEERVRAGSELFESWCHLARAGIRGNFPEAGETEIQRQLRNRLRIARQLDRRVPE